MTASFICLMLVGILFQLSTPLPDAASRFRRHADGLFTSELSKIKNDVAMRSFLRSLLTSKRSVSELNFPSNSEENEAKSEEQACFNWLYQSFLSESLPSGDALKATQESYKLVCQPLGHFIVSLKEHAALAKLLEIKE